MKFYYTYVLLSQKDKKFYIGYSVDVFNRLKQHNDKQNVSTKGRTPFDLLYYEAHLNKLDALRRESYFITSSYKRTLRKMLKCSLNDLL